MRNSNFLKHQDVRFFKNPKLFAFKMASIVVQEAPSITGHASTLPALQRACRERVLPFPVSFVKRSLAIFVALNTNTEVITLSLAVHAENLNLYCYNIKVKISAYQKLKRWDLGSFSVSHKTRWALMVN